ncbi:hypothetical protein Tco_0542032 [Tanacetum coccineum]
MSTLKQTSDEYHQESSITIQHCSFFISTMDLYGHTLKEDGFKYRLKFMLDKKELSLTMDDSEQSFTYHKQLTIIMIIPAWMISEEMKHTEHYRMYAEVFGIDVPLTQSQPTESTQGTHRITSAPRRSTRLTPPAPVPTVDKAGEMILQDTLQVSLVEHKRRKEQEARENVALVDEHLASEEIEKMVDGQENIVDDSSIPMNDEPNIPGTRIEPRSNKESPEVEITKDKEVDITNVVIPVNVNDEDE